MSRLGDVSVSWLCRVAPTRLEVRGRGAGITGRRDTGEEDADGEAAGAAVCRCPAVGCRRGARARRAALLPPAEGVPRCARGARAEAGAGAGAEGRTDTPQAPARRIDLALHARPGSARARLR